MPGRPPPEMAPENSSAKAKGLDMGTWIQTYFRERPGITAAYASVILLFPLGSVVIPAMLGTIGDNVKNDIPVSLRMKVAAGVVVCILLGLSIAWFYLDAWIAADMMAQLRKTIFSEVMRAYSHNYQSLHVSSIIAKAINLPNAVFDVVRLWHHQIIPGLLIITCVGAFIFWNDRWTGFGVLAAFVSMAVAFWGAFHVCADRVVEADYGNDAVQEKIGDSLENLLHVYLADAADEEIKMFQRELEAQNDRFKNARNCSNHFMGVIKFFISTLAVLVVYSLIQRYFRDKKKREAKAIGELDGMTVGKLSAVFFTMMCSTHVIFNAIDAWPRAIFKTAQVQKTQTFFNDLAEHARSPSSAARPCDPSAAGFLIYHNVRFRYPGRENDALQMDGDTLALQRSERVRLMGHIGSGKSTLATLALGLYDYHQGSIRLDGREVRSMSRTDIARMVTYVPQGPQLLNRTILANLMLGAKRSEQSVRCKIENLKHELGDDLAFLDLDKVVGKGGKKLSGGQRAMVCLLRAMVNETPIIICDEITANLDHDIKQSVLKLIEKVSENKLLVFITHDTTIPDVWFHRKVEMADGKVARITNTRAGTNPGPPPPQ